MKSSLLLAAFFTALYVLLGPQLLAGLTKHEDVRETAERYLPWQWAAPLLSVAAYLLDGFFVGAALPGPMRDSMLVALATFLALVHLPYGNDALWAAYLAHLLVRGVLMGCMYPRIEALCREPLLGKP